MLDACGYLQNVTTGIHTAACGSGHTSHTSRHTQLTNAQGPGRYLGMHWVDSGLRKRTVIPTRKDDKVTWSGQQAASLSRLSLTVTASCTLNGEPHQIGLPFPHQVSRFSTVSPVPPPGLTLHHRVSRFSAGSPVPSPGLKARLESTDRQHRHPQLGPASRPPRAAGVR